MSLHLIHNVGIITGIRHIIKHNIILLRRIIFYQKSELKLLFKCFYYQRNNQLPLIYIICRRVPQCR